jgi:hypothetical protein
LVRLALLLLTACTTTHGLRAQVIDGESGRMLAGEKLTIRTSLRSSWCTDTSSDSDGHWILGNSRTTTTTTRRTDSTTATVRSGRDGWARIPIIDRTGICRYRPTEITVWARKAQIAEVHPDERGPLVLPVFAYGGPPRTTAPDEPFVAHRAKAAFPPLEAVRSVYAERFIRDSDDTPVVFSSRDPSTFLVGYDPFASDPKLDGGDPFRRVALATVRGAGLAWRVELRAVPTTPDLHYVVPPAFAAQRDPIAVWARQALHELVVRRVEAARLFSDRRYYDAWRVDDATVRDGAITGTLTAIDDRDDREIVRLRVPLDRFARIELLDYRHEDRGRECRFEWLFHPVRKYLPDHAPPSPTCTNGHADGCMLGLDPWGRAWRGSCVVDGGVVRARAWPAQ